jgi:hypothetical protein
MVAPELDGHQFSEDLFVRESLQVDCLGSAGRHASPATLAKTRVYLCNGLDDVAVAILDLFFLDGLVGAGRLAQEAPDAV